MPVLWHPAVLAEVSLVPSRAHLVTVRTLVSVLCTLSGPLTLQQEMQAAVLLKRQGFPSLSFGRGLQPSQSCMLCSQYSTATWCSAGWHGLGFNCCCGCVADLVGGECLQIWQVLKGPRLLSSRALFIVAVS